MRISDWSSDVCSSDLLDSHWHKDSAIAGAVLASDKHGRVRIVESDTNIAFALLGEDIEKISRVEADDQIFAGVVDFDFFRSEERRVGKECVSTVRSWWVPYH